MSDQAADGVIARTHRVKLDRALIRYGDRVGAAVDVSLRAGTPGTGSRRHHRITTGSPPVSM